MKSLVEGGEGCILRPRPPQVQQLDGPSRAVYLPTNPPRRVAVYRCQCGEAGCGCAAPIIVERNGCVIWEDTRDVTGVYVDPNTRKRSAWRDAA